MIRRLRVSNYRSLARDVEINFEPLTVFVGQNGSGKSNVLDALLFVSHALQMGLAGAVTQRSGIEAVRRWSDGHPYNMSFHFDLDLPDGSAIYSFEITGDKQAEYRVKSESAEVRSNGEVFRFDVNGTTWKSNVELRPALTPTSLALPAIAGDVRFSALATHLQQIAVYSIFPDTLRTPQKYDPTKPMLRHGENWASILVDQDPSTWKPALVTALQKLVGDVTDIEVKRTSGYLVPRLRHQTKTRSKRTKWFDVGQQSDGTLRAAGIITALLQDPPVPVIAIEEPELTIHPGATPLLANYIREASERSQVLLSSHSPEILDLVRPEEVRVVFREDDGCTRVEPIVPMQIEMVRDNLMSMSDMLRTVGFRPQLDLPLEHL